MKVIVTLVGDSSPFTSKTGRSGFVTACQFEDDGARFPLGRGRIYSDAALDRKALGGKVTARLVSYDRGEGRFSV